MLFSCATPLLRFAVHLFHGGTAGFQDQVVKDVMYSQVLRTAADVPQPCVCQTGHCEVVAYDFVHSEF